MSGTNPEAEPVGSICLRDETGLFSYVPVYLHPPRPSPARKPMTEEEIQKGVKRLKEMVGNKSSEVYAAFEVGIRVAEKYHEIGGGDE
ncbi:MAG: hypothetical protein RLZ25_1058 [Pseudomonadota bacterium]|jgi:hypothetical protein